MRWAQQGPCLQGKRRAGSHAKGVMGLAWNAQYRNVLASGSADTTVKVWDVTCQQCQATLAHHSGKVQAVAWNPADAPVLLSGGFDRRVCLVGALADGVHLPWHAVCTGCMEPAWLLHMRHSPCSAELLYSDWPPAVDQV